MNIIWSNYRAPAAVERIERSASINVAVPRPPRVFALPPPPRPRGSLPNPQIQQIALINHGNNSNINLNNNDNRPGAFFLPQPEPDIEFSDDDSMEIEVEEIDGNGKRTRKTRKLTNWSFVDRIDNNSSYCKCGCLDADGFDRKKLVTPTSGAITPHVKKKHPELWSMKTQLKINRGNLNQWS